VVALVLKVNAAEVVGAALAELAREYVTTEDVDSVAVASTDLENMTVGLLLLTKDNVVETEGDPLKDRREAVGSADEDVDAESLTDPDTDSTAEKEDVREEDALKVNVGVIVTTADTDKLARSDAEVDGEAEFKSEVEVEADADESSEFELGAEFVACEEPEEKPERDATCVGDSIGVTVNDVAGDSVAPDEGNERADGATVTTLETVDEIVGCADALGLPVDDTLAEKDCSEVTDASVERENDGL
jgi:hypothetical protein